MLASSLKIAECDQEIEKIIAEMKTCLDKDGKEPNKPVIIKRSHKKHGFSFDMHQELI